MPLEGYDKSMAKPTGLKSRFVRGIAALLPTLLTIWVVSTVWRFTFDTIAAPINASIREAVIWTADVLPPLRDAFQPSEEQLELAQTRAATRGETPPTQTELLTQNIDEWWSNQFGLELIGLLVALLGIALLGTFLQGMLGRWVWRRFEVFLARLPIVRAIYPSAKQLVDFVLGGGERAMQFERPVVIEYPRPGIWSLGFATGSSLKTVRNLAQTEMVTVFIPNSPTPFTGFTVNLPKAEVHEVNMTVDEAIRFTISGGVIVSETESSAPLGAESAESKPAS